VTLVVTSSLAVFEAAILVNQFIHSWENSQLAYKCCTVMWTRQSMNKAALDRQRRPWTQKVRATSWQLQQLSAFVTVVTSFLTNSRTPTHQA